MIELNDVIAGYGDEPVLNRVSLQLAAGEFLAVLGPNGAGKSTLIRAILGYLEPVGGQVVIAGKNIKEWRRIELARIIALIPQEIQLQFDYSVRELVLMGRYPYLGFWQNYTARDLEIVEVILQQFFLSSLQDKFFNQLSGGEKQRVLLARAMAQDTPVILMDEAFSHLDINHQIEIMDLLAEVNRKQHKAILLVSHNINLAAEYCNRLILLKEGRIIGDGHPQEMISQESLLRLYGTELLVVKNPRSGRPCLLYPGRR
ncbi:MAG: ABC transporter ATP-binding protein [Candidatus Cloacimonetes bacterium]|nr:ABC transporter ATP-binding protein [Candidatus Cloacimonadota bacterium]